MAASDKLPNDRAYAAVIEGYAATLQHLALLKQKREQLQAIQRDAESQHLQRISCAYWAGLITKDDLVLIYDEFKSLSDAGYSIRWNDAVMPLRAAEIDAHRRSLIHRRPNGPYGTWEGAYPFNGSPTPGERTCVVYVLFDATNVPCYVGSTRSFRMRLNRHAADGKEFCYWRAHPCADRAAAYALEDSLLKQFKPYLNKRAAA